MGSTNILDLNNRVSELEKDIGSITASDVAYDNTTSGLTATYVQGAVDEINDNLSNLVKVTTVTGTTNENGVLSINIAANKKIVDIKIGTYMALPFVRPGEGGGTIEIVLFDYASDRVLRAQPNKTVTATVYYID